MPILCSRQVFLHLTPVKLPKIGLAQIHLAGGLGDLRFLRYELRKRLFWGNLLFDHVYLILPFLANTCRHRPISVKSTSTGWSLFAIITSTAQPRSSFQYLNSASALSLTSPLKHCWCLSWPERLRIAYFKLLFIEKISPILISSKHTHNSPWLATDHQIWKNFATNQPMTSKAQLPCRLMHR